MDLPLLYTGHEANPTGTCPVMGRFLLMDLLFDQQEERIA